MNIASTFPTLFPNIQRYTPLLQSYSQPTSTNSSERDLKAQQPPTHQHAASTTITMFTRNEIERAFLLHRPDLIKTMSLPIQRLPAFQSIGPKLSSLVRFELSGITWQFNLGPAIEFLQQHAQLFGTIRELRMAGPNDVRVMQKPKIHQIVKAIKHPKLFDLSRYKEASRDLNSYEIQNVGTLEKLLFDLDFVPVPQSSLPSQPSAISVLNPIQSSVVTAATQSQIQDEISPGQSDNTLGLIQQCTNLSTLHIGVQSPTGFSWAVDRYKNDPRSVQQFKVLHLSSNRTAIVKQAIEDCVYAFQDSLEDLKGVSLKLSAMTTSLSNMDTTFGWSWPLNRLSVLSLKGELAVWFDFESLRYCPKLTELHLNLLPYSPPKIDHLEKVSLASQLTVLSLLGRWILTDRIIDNLAKGLQRLKTLTMDGCECNTATQLYLTPKGLTSGLDKMKQLQKLDVNLFGQIEAEMREYRVSRPELEIRIQSDATE
ncbi:hypothetical protein BGZ49_006913 [Haplosporangium sp. Z 27]|nr:hypothetical protein BGZ49_006913 [Haplosporangium sp. Z 27]